jgi:hypothetical protein
MAASTNPTAGTSAFCLQRAPPVDRCHTLALGDRKNRLKGAAVAARHVFRADQWATQRAELSNALWNGIILALYLGLTMVIGYGAHWHARKPNSYLNSGRSLPLWVVAIAYLAVNCGALDVIGLSAMAAQYGVQAFHFYWIGAVPAIIFLSCWMMPVYRRSGIRSVPEFLELRYGPRLRLLNVCVLLVSMVLLAGISLYAVALILQFTAGFTFLFSVSTVSVAVLTYVLLGGIRGDDLQRSASVCSDDRGAGASVAPQRFRSSLAQCEVGHACLVGSSAGISVCSFGCSRSSPGIGFCAELWVLVHGFCSNAACFYGAN